MKLSDQLWLSFHNLMLHKIRSVLTSLGIIFGVGSVIAMLSISEGAKREALAQIESMGVDKIDKETAADRQGCIREYDEQQSGDIRADAGGS